VNRPATVTAAAAIVFGLTTGQVVADPPASTVADSEQPSIQPDPRAVAEAREANLEPESVREGLAIGLALGPSMQVGFGLNGASGTGGGFDVRLGTVASPRWVWLIEVGGTLHVKSLEMGGVRAQHRNQSILFTGGGQLYLKDAIWLRGGAGFAAYTQTIEANGLEQVTLDYKGVGVIGAGGLDLVRRRGFALSGEVLVTAAHYPKGDLTVAGGALQLGVSWY
jgi:hypothetical protein